MQHIVQEMKGIKFFSPGGRQKKLWHWYFTCAKLIFLVGGVASFSILMMVNCRGSAENKAEADHQ